MPNKGDLIILENGTGGNITSMVKMNDGRYSITVKSINGKSFSFMQGDYDYKTVLGFVTRKGKIIGKVTRGKGGIY